MPWALELSGNGSVADEAKVLALIAELRTEGIPDLDGRFFTTNGPSLTLREIEPLVQGDAAVSAEAGL